MILVCKVEFDGVKLKYEIIVGECCFCVLCFVGLIEVFVFVKDVLDELVVVMVLIENI